MPSWKISRAPPRSTPPVSAVWVLVAIQAIRRPSRKMGLITIIS